MIRSNESNLIFTQKVCLSILGLKFRRFKRLCF